jgi:hypothetical protein
LGFGKKSTSHGPWEKNHISKRKRATVAKMAARKNEIHHLPSAGPRNGAAANNPVASPRSALLNISEMMPPVLVIVEEPNADAKKRRTSKAVMLGAHAAATLKAVYAVYETTKMDLRPYTSDRGAQIRGPRANPKTKSDKPSVATSEDTSKRLMTPSIPPTYAELAKVTAKVDRDWRMAMAHFRPLEKFIASWESWCR